MLLPALTTPLVKNCMFRFQTVQSMQHSEVKRSQNTQLQRCNTDKQQQKYRLATLAKQRTLPYSRQVHGNEPQPTPGNPATNGAHGRHGITLQRSAGRGSRTAALATTSQQDHTPHMPASQPLMCQANALLPSGFQG
jgi:hypothetical protein